MKILKLEISGFRNFKEKTTITDKDITGNNLIALVGKNGSGKSTILEIIYWILGSNSYSQMTDGYFAKGVHRKNGAKFYLEVKIDPSEKQALLAQIRAKDSYNADIATQSFDSFFGSNDTFSIDLQIDLNRNRAVNEKEFKVTAKFNNSEPITLSLDNDKTTPGWLSVAKSHRLLCTYVGLISGVSLGQQQAFSIHQDSNPIGDAFNFSSDQRSSRVDISLDSSIGSLVMRSIWGLAQQSLENSSRLTVDDDIEELNKVIHPLSLNYDRELLNDSGSLNFYISNIEQSSDMRYPISDISAGERQMVTLWTALKNFQRSKFKPILLLDEPDNSLHPDYIERIGDLIVSSIANSNGTCIIATHSTDLVTKMPNHVYNISTENHRLEKIDSLDKRIKLFSELGRSIDANYLAGKVVLTEGAQYNTNDNEGLPDHEIFQTILDPERKRLSFIPTGRKKDTQSAKTGLENIVSILVSIKLDDIITIVDQDHDIGQPDKAKVLPVYSIENIFIQNATALEQAVRNVLHNQSFSVSQSGILKNINVKTSKGKDVLKSLDSYLCRKYPIYKETGRMKAIQREMLARIDKDREVIFGKELNDFFKQIERYKN